MKRIVNRHNLIFPVLSRIFARECRTGNYTNLQERVQHRGFYCGQYSATGATAVTA